MSKYEPLWDYVRKSGERALVLTFEEIREIAGIAIDHAFLTYKKELREHGYEVGKISMKKQTVAFRRMEE